MPATLHIVTSPHGTSGAMACASTLEAMLRNAGRQTTWWLDVPGPGKHAARTIQAFSGSFPRGGTLILLGCDLKLEPWIAHARPERIIVACDTTDSSQAFRMLAMLAQTGLPAPEMTYGNARLRDAVDLPGAVCPELVDIEVFTPRARAEVGQFTIGRVSSDAPGMHHTDDPSLYRMLAWNGVRVCIMGGICLQPVLGGLSNIDLMATGQMGLSTFLQNLDVFFYRTAAPLNDTTGRTVIQALACGLPVVAHRSCDYADWIRHGENGFLFDRQEDAWQYLNMLKDDAALRSRLGAEACHTVARLATVDSPPAREYLAWLLR